MEGHLATLSHGGHHYENMTECDIMLALRQLCPEHQDNDGQISRGREWYNSDVKKGLPTAKTLKSHCMP